MADRAAGILGTGWRFPPRFDLVETVPGRTVIGKAAMVADETDILQSLDILMTTIMGERVMRPTYGLGIQTHVFDATDETSLTYLRDRIDKAVLFGEPRIRLEAVNFDLSALMGGRLDIQLGYVIPATNSRGNKVFPFYLSEGTHVQLP